MNLIRNAKLKSMILFLGVAMSFLIAMPAQAATLNFSADPQLPENQIEKGVSYFDLKMEPSQKQTIIVKLKNDTDKEVVIEPLIKSASTNLNGVVEYGLSNTKIDKTAPYNLEDIVSSKMKEIKIPAKGTIDYPLDIAMPDQSFDGILAGGITLSEKEPKDTNDEKNEAGMAVQNKYAYTIALILHGKQDITEPELKLTKVEAGQVNARNVMNATIQNPKAMYIKKLAIDTKIYKKGSEEVLYESKKEEMQVAPNSSFAYPISLNGEKLEAGDYRIKMVATATDGQWEFDQEFTITADKAKKLNESDVILKSQPNYTWIYIASGILIALLILLIVLISIRRIKKKEKELKRMKVEMRNLKAKKRKKLANKKAKKTTSE